MVGLISVLLVVLGGASVLVAAVHASTRARTAADLAALAADAHLLDGSGGECAAAYRVAGAGGGRLVACVLAGDTVTVTVELGSGALRSVGLGPARARSRAGPSAPRGAAE